VKKAISIFVALLFVFAMASLSLAAEEKKAAPAPAPMEKKAEPAKPAEKPKVHQVTGDVKAVDAKAMTVTVSKMMKGKAAEETVVTVSDKTKIKMDKENKTLADVKVGDKVTVKYTEAEGKKMAKSIAIHEPEKKAEPAKAMEKPAKPAEKK
jgi:ribosomal protein S1